MLPSVLPRLSTDSAVRRFPSAWKPSLFKTPFPGQNSVPPSFVSLFVFYIFFLPPFEDLGCFSGCLMSSAGIQKLFCGIHSAFKCSFDEFVGEKVFSPSYSSAILAPPPPLQYSCLKNSMDRGAWRATVHKVAWSRTRQSAHTRTRIRTHTHFL